LGTSLFADEINTFVLYTCVLKKVLITEHSNCLELFRLYSIQDGIDMAVRCSVNNWRIYKWG